MTIAIEQDLELVNYVTGVLGSVLLTYIGDGLEGIERRNMRKQSKFSMFISS
jgi:hypothetical protein